MGNTPCNQKQPGVELDASPSFNKKNKKNKKYQKMQDSN